MRSLWVIVLCVMLVTAQTLAQQTTDDEAEQLRRANRKITIGLALMGAGALAAPLTALARRQGDTGGPTMNVSIGMIFVGGGVVGRYGTASCASTADCDRRRCRTNPRFPLPPHLVSGPEGRVD